MIISKIILMPKPILMLNLRHCLQSYVTDNDDGKCSLTNCWNNRIDTAVVMMLMTIPMMMIPMMITMMTMMTAMMMMMMMMMTHVVGQTAVPKSPIHYSVGEPACLLAGTSKF